MIMKPMLTQSIVPKPSKIIKYEDKEIKCITNTILIKHLPEVTINKVQ